MQLEEMVRIDDLRGRVLVQIESSSHYPSQVPLDMVRS